MQLTNIDNAHTKNILDFVKVKIVLEDSTVRIVKKISLEPCSSHICFFLSITIHKNITYIFLDGWITEEWCISVPQFSWTILLMFLCLKFVSVLEMLLIKDKKKNLLADYFLWTIKLPLRLELIKCCKKYLFSSSWIWPAVWWHIETTFFG